MYTVTLSEWQSSEHSVAVLVSFILSDNWFLRHIGEGWDFSVLAVRAVGVRICQVVKNPCTESLEQMPRFWYWGETAASCPQLADYFMFILFLI